MDAAVLESVSKVFRHKPALFNWIGKEQGGQTRALNEISLRAPKGKILVLLGPNGSGKTTLLKLIATVLLPDSGRVLVEGADTRDEPGRVRGHVGFAIAAERSFFPRLSARENLDFFATLDNVPRHSRPREVERVLDCVGLLEQADILVMKFSSGMYQRLGMARALIKNPSLILLDEPTRSVDPGSAAHCWELVHELPNLGSTVIIATHSFQEASAVGDEVAVLSRGSLAGLRRSPANAEELRSFYFQATGESDPAVALVSGGHH
jgi:ABC-2 type transport system ATP-binding protein